MAIFTSLMMVATGCSQQNNPTPPATTTAPTATTASTVTVTPTPQVITKDKTYNVLNPAGDFIPVTIKPLSPRLDTLDGKLIYVDQGEADPVIMPALWERVQKDYPKTNWKYIAIATFGPTAVEAEVLGTAPGTKKADAVIRGIGW